MKTIKIIMIVSLTLFLCSCQIKSDKSIYFDNECLIVTDGDSYSYLNRLGNMDDLHIEDFSGTETIYTLSNTQMIKIKTNYTIRKGRFKVVLIGPNDEITELNGEQTIILEEKNFRIKIVGDHAYVHLTLQIES